MYVVLEPSAISFNNHTDMRLVWPLQCAAH